MFYQLIISSLYVKHIEQRKENARYIKIKLTIIIKTSKQHGRFPNNVSIWNNHHMTARDTSSLALPM